MASSSGKALHDHVVKHNTKHAKKPSTLLLKDYLRDDLSSCSSSGFKSFPRRQCCTTVGFRVEKDLQIQRKRIRNPSSSSSSYFSTVSEAVINAIKSLPLSQKRKGGAGVLSRSFSRKVLSRRFWRKAAKEEETVPRRRRRSFGELIMEDKVEPEKTTSFNGDRENNTVLATVQSFTTASSICDSNSWVESDFTFSSAATSSNDVDSVEHYNERAPRHNMEGLTVTDWLNEKEQFSPVSVLDCAFEDEEFYKSHFNSNSTTDNSCCKGTKKEHMQKIRQHFKGVVSLKPVALEKRFACFDRTNVYHDKMEENAGDLLNMVKKSIECSKCVVINAENMLFDYFKQSIEEKKDMGHSEKLHLCKVAEDWIQGQQQELYLGWEVESERCMYIREMDKLGEWRNSDQEMQQLVVDLENHLFSDLVKDLVLDLTTSCASK